MAYLPGLFYNNHKYTNKLNKEDIINNFQPFYHPYILITQGFGGDGILLLIPVQWQLNGRCHLVTLVHRRVYMAPATETETMMCRIWQSVGWKLGITDNFFG